MCYYSECVDASKQIRKDRNIHNFRTPGLDAVAFLQYHNQLLQRPISIMFHWPFFYTKIWMVQMRIVLSRYQLSNSQKSISRFKTLLRDYQNGMLSSSDNVFDYRTWNKIYIHNQCKKFQSACYHNVIERGHIRWIIMTYMTYEGKTE